MRGRFSKVTNVVKLRCFLSRIKHLKGHLTNFNNLMVKLGTDQDLSTKLSHGGKLLLVTDDLPHYL